MKAVLQPVQPADDYSNYETDPSRYRHWQLTVDGPVATLSMHVDEDGGLKPGYKLKLNSYDLGVDIELHDAVQRIRFEHPEVRSVVVTSLRERIFCSGETRRDGRRGAAALFCAASSAARLARTLIRVLAVCVLPVVVDPFSSSGSSSTAAALGFTWHEPMSMPS